MVVTYLKINSWLYFFFSHHINNTPMMDLVSYSKKETRKNDLVMICSSLFPLAEQAQRFTSEMEQREGKALITP